MGNACFRFFGDEIEDGGASCFAAGPSSGGNGDKGRKGFGYWEAAAAARRLRFSKGIRVERLNLLSQSIE